MKEIISELNRIKTELGLTYEQISDYTGVNLSTVQKVLGGKIQSPRLDTIEALKKLLYLSKDDKEEKASPREISIGNQDFKTIIENNYFYMDKTMFIKEWWESGDIVTLITRPRRFGKTLNMSMVNYFFSNAYKDSGALFEGLEIWNNMDYRRLQGQYPTIFISFASVKGNTYEMARAQIVQEIVSLYRSNQYLIEEKFITDKDRKYWELVDYDMTDAVASNAIKFICELMYRK